VPGIALKILGCAALLASGALAADPVNTASPPATAKAEPAPKKVCRTTNQTGSHLGGRKTCRTVAEWEALDAKSRTLVGDTRARPNPY
jgi:hypothetical protein